jgi:LacI family transcriptional regulator
MIPGPMHTRRITITDVAEEAGVSIATVSKVINDRYGVAPATSSRVREVIDRMGYTSSLGAASLRNRTTNVLAVLVTEIEPFSAELLKGVSRELHDTDYELLIYVGGKHRSDPGWEPRYVSRLSGTLADGVILVTPSTGNVRAAVPVVAVDPHDGVTVAPCITSDNLSGGIAATDHLLRLGHRRIAFLGGRPDLQSSTLRERGFRTAMGAAGIPIDESLVLIGGYRAESSVRPAHEMLERDQPPTAVFAANDQSAIEVMHVAAELGIPVPDRLSVVGFDDTPDAAQTSPPLTTIAQPIQEMGAQAARVLIGMINGTEPPERVTLPTVLVERKSTAPV